MLVTAHSSLPSQDLVEGVVVVTPSVLERSGLLGLTEAGDADF